MNWFCARMLKTALALIFGMECILPSTLIPVVQAASAEARCSQIVTAHVAIEKLSKTVFVVRGEPNRAYTLVSGFESLHKPLGQIDSDGSQRIQVGTSSAVVIF